MSTCAQRDRPKFHMKDHETQCGQQGFQSTVEKGVRERGESVSDNIQSDFILTQLSFKVSELFLEGSFPLLSGEACPKFNSFSPLHPRNPAELAPLLCYWKICGVCGQVACSQQNPLFPRINSPIIQLIPISRSLPLQQKQQQKLKA